MTNQFLKQKKAGSKLPAFALVNTKAFNFEHNLEAILEFTLLSSKSKTKHC